MARDPKHDVLFEAVTLGPKKTRNRFTYCNHWVEHIGAGKVRLTYLYKFGPDLVGPSSGRVPRKDNGGEFDLGVDAVILVTARYSEDRLWRELKARKAEWTANGIQDIFRAGDCKAPAQLNQAMWDAHRPAREFDSPHPAYPLPWIRERQLWGSATIPKLGDRRVRVEP
jgi:dimethylamine/trimethylamine dehydrogenase